MTDKQMEEKKKEFEDLISVELQEWYRLGLHDGFKIDDDMLLSHKEMVEGVIKKQPSTEIWDFIEKLVEEVEREQLNQIEELSEEMEGNFNNTMFTSGFQTALDEVYYRLSGGKFLDEVLEEKSKKTTN